MLVAGAAFGYLAFFAPGRGTGYSDPAAGFSLRYPPTWTLMTDPDGSHPTMLDPTTGATISAYATTVPGAPQAVLREAVPQGATQMQQRTIAGTPAVDFVVPSTQGSGGGEAGTPTPPQIRMVLLATKNSAGTTNVYTVMLAQRAGGTDESGAFESVLSSLALSAGGSWLPFASSPATPAPVRATTTRRSCGAICWADANWTTNDYTDNANGQACAAFDDNSSQYVQCVTGTSAAPGYFQPGFQCSEFVSRALAQAGLIPGLAAGGYDSAGSAGGGTGEWGNYSLNSYPFTYVGNAAGGDTRYNLLGVGTAGTPGLYQYLLDSGIGVSIGQNVAAASPGDIVFLYSGSIADENREHVMLITAVTHDASRGQGIGGWDALLDGHNRAAYHRLLSTVTGPGNPFEIIHLRVSRSASSLMATSGSGWATNTDGYGQSLGYVATTSATIPTATASLRLPAASACALAVYVPDSNATTVATFRVTLANGVTATRAVDESAVDGWVLLYRFGDAGLPSPPRQIVITNATGADGQTLGVGVVAALCSAS